MYLLHILLGSNIGRMHKGSHDLHIAVDNQGLVRPVRVDAHSAVMIHRVWHLPSLPQHFTVTLKLTWIRCLRDRGRETEREERKKGLSNRTIIYVIGWEGKVLCYCKFS